MIHFKAENKPAVLAALFNSSKPLAMGLFHFKPAHTMTLEEATGLLKKQTYFGRLKDRIMAVDLSGDRFDDNLYDHNNGPGAALKALGPLGWLPGC